MPSRRKTLIYNALGFGVLFLISLYRQLSLRFLPNDPLRTYILYAGYVALVTVWAVSIFTRVTQRAMRTCILLEAAFILLGLTIRFLQDTFWYQDTLLMRVSGLYVAATLLPMMLLALYATLCMGQADSFRLPRKWYVLLVPFALLGYLLVTDERRHLMFFLVQSETQPNIQFHPSVGVFLLFALGVTFMVIRVWLIYAKNKKITQQGIMRWVVPLFEPILIVVFTLDYFLAALQVTSMLANMEVIELYARIYYIEAITWEFYIYIGLVPVNTCYEDVFRNSTIAMQIVDGSGSLRSKYALELTPELLGTLEREGMAVLADKGAELHLYPLESGCFVWQKDISKMQATIDDLRRSAEELRQEGGLLDEEMRAKSEEARIRAQNRIYDGIVKEVEPQLALMRVLAGKCRDSSESEALFGQLCLIGTYVKRRCNLRLMEQGADGIAEEELQLSFADMLEAAKQMGIETRMDWRRGNELSPAFSVYLLNMLEFLLEYERFSLSRLELRAQDDRVSFTVTRSTSAPERTPREEVAQMNPKGYLVDWQSVPDGYRLLLSEGGA